MAIKSSRCVAAAIVLGCVGAASANLTGAVVAAQPAAAQPAAAVLPTEPVGGTATATAVTGGVATGTVAEAPGMALGPTAAGVATITDPTAFAAVEPTYTLYAGYDYGPLTVPPPTVPILDIDGGSLMVADAAECAAQCSMAAGCNCASYYGDNPVELWPGGLNCYLKTLTGCALPADALVTGDATIFMIGGPDCVAGATVAVAPTAVVAAAAPLGATTAVAPTGLVAAPITPAVGATGVTAPVVPVAMAPSPASAVAGTDPAAVDPAFTDTSVAAGPAGTSDNSGLDSPDTAVDSFPQVSPTPSAAPMLHMHGLASAAAVLFAGAALML